MAVRDCVVDWQVPGSSILHPGDGPLEPEAPSRGGITAWGQAIITEITWDPGDLWGLDA